MYSSTRMHSSASTMRGLTPQFPRNTRFMYLQFLHYIGLVSIPHYHSSPSLNLLHKYVYSGFVYTCICLWTVLSAINTFCFAINDVTEFLQRVLETLYMVTFFLEVYKFNVHIQGCIDLLSLMDRTFVPPSKYKRNEMLVLKVVLGLGVAIFVTFTLEKLLPLREVDIRMMETVYHRGYPHRTLLMPVWVPFDINDIKTYIVIFVVETYMMGLLLVSVCQLVILESMFTTPLLEQYELFSLDLELIGEDDKVAALRSKPRDIEKSTPGVRTFLSSLISNFGKYTRTITYVTEVDRVERNEMKIQLNFDSKSSKIDTTVENENSKVLKRTESVFQIPIRADKMMDKKGTNRHQLRFMRKIVIRSQQLTFFVNQFKNHLEDVIEPCVYPILMMAPLATYQLVLIPHLSTITGIKILVEFSFTVYALTNVIVESEKLEDCHRLVCAAMRNSKWYLASPEVRKQMGMMLRVSQRPNILSLHHGMVRVNYNFGVKIVKAAYTFVNFMHLMRR